MTVLRRDVKFDEEKAMQVSLERELELHAEEEILVPKAEPHIDVEQPHAKVLGVETSTQEESSREGRKHTREADILLDDAWENEAMQKPFCVDAMVEENDSIVQNSAWDVVPRPEDKSVVSSHWLYKVKKDADGSVEKHKAIFVTCGFSQVEGINYDDTCSPVASDEKLIKYCKEDLAREFEMKDMGLMHYFIGLEVWQGDGELFVSQGKYANAILRIFRMESSKPIETPLDGNWRKEDATSGEVVEATIYRQLVGSLMYLVNTLPNMCYAVNQLSQAMVRPTKLYWKVAKHVLRYLRGTTQFGLWYR
eukprot:PITA_02729